MTAPDNAAATSSYSGNTVTVSDQAGKSRKSVTDALGRLTSVYEDPSGLNYQTSYNYDVLGDLLTVTQGVQTRTFVYDSLKRVTSATNPESGTVSYTYDNNGNMLTKLDARSITTTIAYDALNRPTSKSYQNDGGLTPAVAYFYDAQSLPAGAPSFSRGYSTGRLVAVTYGGTSAGNYAGYDAVGRTVRKIQQTDSVNYLVEAVYNVSGAMTSETYPSVPGYGDRRVITAGFDTAGRLSSMSSNATSYAPAASVSGITYASHGALASETYGNNLIHAATYNSRLQTSEIKLGTSGAPTSILDLVYNYGTSNNNGNLQSVSYSGGGLSYSQTFSYDSLNRLATAQENSGVSWSQTNGYDRYANRWIALPGGGQSIYCNTSNNRVTGWSYDASGDLLNDGVTNYTYDAEGHLKTVNSATAYVYDGGGQRVRKLVGENIRFVYGIGGELIAEFDGSTGSLKKEYVYGGGTVAIVEPTNQSSNGTRYSTPDHLGSPRVVSNASGGVVSRHDYMPFGEELFAGTGGRTVAMGFSVADGNRKKFTGYERYGETGLDFAQARYYANNQGRFTSPDPFGGSMTVADPQSFNRYAYVQNSPLNFIDPSGLDWTTDASQHGPSSFNPVQMAGAYLDEQTRAFFGDQYYDLPGNGNELERAEAGYADGMRHIQNALLATYWLNNGHPDWAKAMMDADKTLQTVLVLPAATKRGLEVLAARYGQAAADQALFAIVAEITGLANYIRSSTYHEDTRTFDVVFTSTADVSEFLAHSPYFAGPGIALLHLSVGTFDYRSYTDLTGGLSLQVVPGRNSAVGYADFDRFNPYQDLYGLTRHNIPIILRRIGRVFR